MPAALASDLSTEDIFPVPLGDFPRGIELDPVELERSMKKAYLPLLFLLAAMGFAGPVKAELEDLVGPTTVTPATGIGLSNPTGIEINGYLYMYYQGDDGVEGGGDPNCFGSAGDRIIAYRALITGGVPGTFQRVGRISPAAKSPTKVAGFWPDPACVNPPAFFGPGQIFQATIGGVTKYHLLADVSDAFVFKTVWRAESTDGINWTWYTSGSGNSNASETLTAGTGGTYTITSTWQSQPFMSANRSLNLLLFNPILRSAAPLTNNADWWGYINYGPGLQFTAMKVEWSTGSPVIKILSATSPSWTYSTLASGAVSSLPPALATDVNVKTLHDEGGTYQAWGWRLMPNLYGSNVSCNTSNNIQCTSPSGCSTGDGSTVANGNFGRPFWLNTGPAGDTPCLGCNGSGIVWWPGVSTTSLGSGEQTLYSTVRSMPSGYPEARNYPFRWNTVSSGTTYRYMFSTTNDANVCTQFLPNMYYYTQVVRTTITP